MENIQNKTTSSKISINIRTFQFGALTLNYEDVKQLTEMSKLVKAYTGKSNDPYYRATEKELDRGGVDTLCKVYKKRFAEKLLWMNGEVKRNTGKTFINGTADLTREEDVNLLFHRWCEAISVF